MAGAFNLTAQLNLKGPSNIGNIVASIKNQLGNINSTVKFTLDPNAAKNVAQLNGNLQGLNQTFKDTQTNATAAANAIKLFGASVGQVGASKLQTSLTSANQASQQLIQTQSALGDSIRSSSSEMQEFGKQAGLAVRRFTAFSTVTSVIYGLVNAASKGVGAFIDFDKELVKLQQVTGESQQGLKALENTITGLSTGLGVSSAELINVASTLAQAGLNASDTEKALKALALSSLAPSFDNMNETVEGSIALMRQFGIGAGELDKALGSVNAVAAKFAVEASDIISAVQRTGGVFAAASRGVSEGTDALNEFVSVFTSVRATTRESAETIATGLRTIFTRIQRESTIEALKEYGVNLTDVSGKFVGAYKSVELLSKGLSNLDPRDLKFSRIIEELGGFRQIGKVIPLIQEFSTAQQALSVAQQGQGSLTADSIKAQMSLANQISKTREEFLKLFREIGSSDAFQTLIRGALSVSSALIKVVESGRGLLPMLGVIAAIQGSKAITRFASGFSEGLTRGGNNKDDNASPSPATPRVRNFAVGGLVPGVGDTDSVPAMLTPGEFVVRKAAVRSIGADRLHSMNRYANGGKAAQIASVNKITNVVDGDTFDAEVTPKANPFTARFRLDNVDTYEKGNKKSRITREKLEDIKEFMPKYVYKSYASESKDPIVIGPSTNVGPKTTARTMADNATMYLASNIKANNFKGVVDSKAGFGRYLATNLGFEIPKEYTTGRYSDDDNGYNLGGRVQRFASGSIVEKSKSEVLSSSPTPMLQAILARVEKNPQAKDYQFSEYRKKITDRLNQAYKGIIMVGQKPSKEDVTKDTVISMYEDYVTRGYIDTTVGALEKDLVYMKGDGGTNKQALKKRKGIEVGDMLDTIRGYQALGLDYVLNTALTEGRTDETIAQFMGDSLPKSFKTTGRGDIKISSLVKNLEAAAQYKMPETLYSGLGKSKLESILEQTKTKQTDGIDKLTGKTFTLPSFVSSSDDKRVADTFARVGQMMISTNPKKKGIIPDNAKNNTLDRESVSSRKKKTKLINSEYGDRGIGGMYINESYTDAYDSEGEYIFPPNSKFKILSAQGRLPSGEDVGNVDMKVQQLRLGGVAQRLAAGGVAQRKVGYIDYDVIANPDNEEVIKRGMEATGTTGPRLYTDYLTQLAVKARKESSLDRLRAIYGVAGSGKTTLARGQGTDSGTLRQTERFPILSPEDIQKATEVLVLSSSVSKDKLDSFFGDTDRTYTLSSTTKEEREEVRSRRVGRDISGIGLENRQPGSTTNAATDTAVSEALLSDRLGNRSVVLGRSESGRLRRKQGDELVDIVKKKIGFTWGGFAPMTAGHESIMDAASAMGIPPEDFIYLVGANEGIKSSDPSSYRTAVFDQDARVLLAKAGAGARGANILPKPRDFEVPLAFDMTGDDARRRVLIPDQGSRTFVADKGEEQTQKYKDAGYGVTYLERTGGISGTMVRDLIMSGDMGKLQEVLSPGVYELISNNIGRIQNRAGVLPEIIEQVKQNQGLKLSEIEQQIKAVGISRIDTKRAASDPEYAAKVQALEELRGRRDKIKSSAAFEPYRLLDEMARKNPEKYGLDFGGSVRPDIQPIRTISSDNERTGSLSPILKSIYDSMDKKPEWLTEFGIPDNITTQIKAKEVAKTLKGKRFPNDESLGDFSGEQIDIENVKQVWRAYGNSSQMKPEKLASYIAAKDYLKSQISQDVQKQSELTIDSIQKSKKVAVVGLRPADKKEVRGPMDLGGENVTMFISGLSSEYSEAVEGWRARQVENDVRFATDIQHKKMFGASDRYAFDFDETLVKGADILDANGKPDIPRYGDINAVRESMKGAALTQLGQKVKQLMGEDPSFIKRSRILTARPQMTAGILADTLQRLGLPFQESDITGVSKPVGDGGLNIVDEKTKRINNSIIAKAKAQDVRELESLIDDNLQNVLETKKTGKKAFHYTEISENLPEDQLQAYGIANIEGASLEMVLARLGARGGSVQNRAVDFDGGLGPAAQYFPGIGYDWPAEVKRTLDSDAIADAKEHFSRFYGEKNGEPQTVQAMAVGGKASRKVGFESGVGASPFGSIVSGKLDSSVYSLEKGSGLSSFEFDEAKRFADSAGYNMEEFKEYLAKRVANKKQNANLRMDPASLLRAITPEKNTSTPKQLALAEMLKGEPDAGYRPILTEAQRIAANRSSVRSSALEDINNATRFAVGGVAEPKQKKEKQYGKIGLTEDGTMINAGYFKNDTRSGYATAYKMRDYLYYVGLSSATSGYGPKLYDVLMEAATEKGAMLTSDRSMVSGDAKNVWEYYFNNRPDVQKTPLKPSDWTRNNALIDPKLYGKEETWPPANDPAWILQSGYSKSPSLINSKDVIRSSAKVDSRALMSSFFSAKRGSSEPVVASNSNGEEFTVSYAKMAKGGKIDEGLDKYKQILSSILPPEFLSDEGLLRDKSGKSEEIEILSPKKKSFFGSLFSGRSRDDTPPASYDGALAYKALRHNLEKSKDQLDPKEYEKLKKYVDGSLAFHGGHDVVDVRKTSHRGALAHESFHDIQGFLYDNYPEIVDKIFSSIDKNKPQVEDWYNNFADKSYTGPGQYGLSHFFPDPDKEAPHVNRAFLSESMEALIRNKKTKTSETTSIAAVKTVDTSSLDLGRNELLPVLLSAASEGDSKAAEILSNIFGSAGLNKDFYKTLPRFAAGGIVPGVGNSDTVPAMLNVGDFVIKKSSVNSVGTDKLASMAGYANGGSVSDQVPALLTPGEFVFSRSSAEKIGYNKLHSINNLGKFANGGMVGGRLALASGGEVNPFFELAQRFFDHLNEVDSRKLPIRPGQNTSTSISLDGSTIDMVKELAVAIESLGIKSSDTAVLLRRGGDISYKAAQEAYEADLQRLKLSSASTEQIIKAENTLTQIREKSLRVTNNRALIESSLFNSTTGQNDGFGAAQQKALLEADKIEASIQKQKEKAFASKLQMPGASPAEIAEAAKTLASTPEEKKDTKDTAFLSAMQKTTGINKSVFADAGLSGSDIRAYMSQSSLDRKTLAEMDKQLIRSKLDEVRNSQQFGSLSLSEQKRRLDEARELTQKEVATRRDILNEIAKSQGLPSLSQKDSGSNIADFFKSPKGMYLSGMIGLAPSLVNSFSPAPTNTGSAVARAATMGGSQTFAAGLQLAGSAGSAAPLVLLGTAAASLAIAFKEARNTFIDFEKQLLGKQLQTSINNLQQSFADLAKDIYDLDIRDNISRDLQSGVSRADRVVDIDKNYARSFMVNLLDAASSSNQNAASDRSRILERFGTSAYLSTTTMGIGSSVTAENNRKLYTERLIPERAQENAKQYSDVAQFAQKSLETMIQAGRSFDEIKASPEYDDIAASLAKANIKVQEQILAIENNNIENTAAAKANREAAKAAVIKAFADDQSAKITKNLVREREAELASRESRTFGMSFDRMLTNMSQSIETTNYSLSKFSETVEASISAMSGQAKLGTTNLDSISVLKNLNLSTPDQKETAINQASSLFGSERGLVSSILKLGNSLEPSIMTAINKTIQDNPGASDTKVSMEIEKVVANKLSETKLPAGLTEQLSKQINSAIDQIRKKEGADNKNRRIDFSELIAVIPALKETFDTLKNTQNAAIASLENWKNRLDAYSKSLDRAADIQFEAAQRRNKAEDILVNGSIELSRAFGADTNPASAARLRDSRTARLTGGPTSVTDIVASLQSLEQTRENQRGNLTALKNSTVGQTGSVQAIMDNERALNKTNYQINQTYAALKNLAESSEAASVAMNAVQSAQQKQAGKVSLLEKLIGSTPEELFNFNNALRRLQLTASGQQLGQTADQRKEVLSVMNDILPLLGNSQEANNLKASTLENLLKDSGVGVNIEFSKIISAIRNPEADPATKLAVEQLKQANEKQADANRALAGLGDNIAARMIESSASVLKSALEQTEVKFDKKQLDDILGGLRDVSTVVRPGEPDRKASGGIIYASAGRMVDFSPKGTDTVPAMLTPGEFVINRSATQKHLPLLQNINSGNYANGGQVRYYADGGYVSSALKPEYKDGINLKKSGKLSTQYEYPDISSLEELRDNSVYFYTLKNLSKMPLPPSVPEILNLPSSGSGPNRDTQKYNLKSEFGVGFPSTGSMLIDTGKDKTNRVSFNRGPSEQASLRPVGRFINPGSEIFKKVIQTKKLEFDQPEDNAIIQRDLFTDLLTSIIDTEKLIPRKISTSKNPKITSDSGDFDIIPLSESNQLKTQLPVTVSMNREYSSSLGSRFKIFFSNLSSLIPQDVGILNSDDPLSGPITDWTKLWGVSKDNLSLLDFFFTGSSIATKTYSDIGNKNSFTYPLTTAPTNAGHIRSGINSESSNLEALANITKTIHDAKDNISKDKTFFEPDSDKKLKASLGFLRNLYQQTSVSEIVDSDLFDLRSLGATQDKVRVFSADVNTWNAKYLEAIDSNIKSSKDKNLESLSYWGKPGAPFTSFSVYPEGGANTRLLPWADAGVPISEDVNAMMQREVDANIKNIIPDTSTVTKQHNFRFKKGPILSQDVAIPYQLDFTKYLNRYWDPDIDALSDEPILDGKPIFLLNTSDAPESPFRSLPLGDTRRLFATESALMDNTIGNNIFSQLNSDNTFLEYLSAVINDGYTSEKATKLENPAIEKFQNILSVADKVGILDKISPLKDQRGELFVKNEDMFGGPAIKVNLRDFLQASTKKLSLDRTAAKENNANKQFSATLDKYDLDRDGKLSQDEKDEAKKDGVDVDRKSYFERSEYPGAALAMILGSQELFGPGGQYELPGVLGRNWFTPMLSNAYNSIYDVPNDRIKSYMAELASYISSRFGDVDQSAIYAAQSDPALYDSIKTAKSYMLGANEAFTKLSSGDTSGIVDFFPAGIFKNQTPNGDPAANKAAIEMFATLGRVSDSSPIANAMIATTLSKDDQKEFSDKLENSMIAKISSKGDITWTKFSPDDLKNSRGEANFKQIFDLALNPYSQFTNRGVRESLLDEFINAIPQARNTDGLPLFTATTGPEYDKSLRLMKKWYGGDGQVSVPLRSWPGVDYLYDQTIMDPAGEPLPFSTKYQELAANLDEQLYADAIMAHDYTGGKNIFGDLPNIRSYEGKEPQYRNKGGIVYASAGGSFVNFKPKGPDVIPAMLSDGEFVVNAKQTAQHLPLLRAINDGNNISSPIGFQDGGMVGSRPFGDPVMATGSGSRSNFRARTISQARANRMRDIGFSSRLTDREIDPSNGSISWATIFGDDSYKKTKDSIQAAFARMASTNKPESFDNYQTTTKFFQDLRTSFEKEKSKKGTKIEDYRKAQRFISGLEKEYLLASRGGGIRLFDNDGIFKDKGLEYDEISDRVSSLRDEADRQFEKNPKEKAHRMKGLKTMEKNLRIAKIGTPPRLSEKGMDPATGALSFTSGIKDNDFESTSRVQSDFTDMAGRGQESRLTYDEYKSKLDNIRDLRSELKTKVDDMDAAAYGRSASYLDSLERELELSARGGGLGVKSKPDMYKSRPYLPTAKQRISAMGKPGEINDQFLDPKTGKITWPLALTDSSLDDTRKRVDEIYAELMTSDNSSMSYEDFAEKRQELQNLTEEFKENVNKYKSGNYGEAKSFLDALTNNFNNVGNKGKDKANTDWRLTGDPKGVSVNASFLKPDGSISWPSAILRDPAFAKYRTAIENDMKNAADLDGAKFDPKQSSSFKDFMDELKDKQEDFGGFDGEHYQARSFIEGLQRSYNNAGQGKPLGGMTLSQQREKQEQERQAEVQFRMNNPVQMLSDSPESTQKRIDKLAQSITYSSVSDQLNAKPLISVPGVLEDQTDSVLDSARYKAETRQQKEDTIKAEEAKAEAKEQEEKTAQSETDRAAVARRKEYERKQNARFAYEDRAQRIKERLLKEAEQTGVWDPTRYEMAYRKVMRSGVPLQEGWKTEDFRKAIETELVSEGKLAQRDWKGVTPSTYYTNSPEYKAQQEKKAKERAVRGPYAPGLPGEIDKAADEFKVGVAQASTLPIRTAAAVSDALLEIGLPEDYSEQKRAVDKVRIKDQERATALTPQENSRLAEQRRRVAVGADRDMFGANVGDKAYVKFLKLSPEDQQEYLRLRDRAQKGMSPTEYTRLDYLQKTLGIPYQQRERIPPGNESSASEAKTNASLADQMRDKTKRDRIPLIGSRQYTDRLPGAFEEGATLGTVLTKEIAPYAQRTEEVVEGTGRVVEGTAKVGAGLVAGQLAGRVGMTGLLKPQAKAFRESSFETAKLGGAQVQLGAAEGIGKNIVDPASAIIFGESSPQATFYATQQRVQQKQFDAIFRQQKAQAEDLAPGLGTSYERAENLSQTAYTAATMAALQDVAVGVFTNPSTAPAKTFTPQDNAARAVSNQQLDDVFTGKRRIVRPSIDLDPKFNEFVKRPLVGEKPSFPDVKLDEFLGRSSQQTTPTAPAPVKFTTPPKPSTWTNGVQPPPSQSWTETQQRLAQSQREIQELLEEVSRTESKIASLPVGTRGKTHWSIDSKTGKLSQDIQLDSRLSETDRAIVAKHELTHVARNATGYRMRAGQLSQDSVAQLPESMTKFAEESFAIRTRYEAMKAAGQKIPAELEKLNAQFRLLEEQIAYTVAGQANAANPALRTSGSVDKYRALVKQIEETMSSPATSSSVPQATSPSWRELMEFPNGRPKPEGFYNLRLSTPDSPLSREMRAFNEDPNRFLPILQETPEINKLSLQEIEDIRATVEADSISMSQDYIPKATKIVGAATVGSAATMGAATAISRLTSDKKEPQKKALGGFIRKYATGGRVAPSFEKSPYAEGTDTVPAMLSEGEFVVNATATAKHLPLLEKLNKGGLAYLAEGSKEPLGYKELKSLAQAQQNYQQSTFGEYLPTWMGGVQKPERTLSKEEQGRLWQEEEKRKVPVFSRLGDAGADMWKRKEVKGDTQAEVAANHAQEMKMHEEALFEEKKKGPSITRFISDASKAAGSKTEELTGSKWLGGAVGVTTGMAGAITDPSTVMTLVATGGLGYLPAMGVESGSAMMGAGFAKAAGDDVGTKEAIIQSIASVAVPAGLRTAFEYGPAAIQAGRRFAGDVASVGGFAERPSWAPLITETEQALAGSRLQQDMAKKGQQLIHATQTPFAFAEGAEFRPNVRPGATPFIELPGAAGMKAAEIEAAVPDSIFADRARPTPKGLQGHANVLGDSNYFAYTGGDQFQAGFDDSFRYALEKAKTSADLSKATLIPAGLPQSQMDEVLSTPAFGTGHETPARESLERLAQTRGVPVDSNMTLAELSNANIRAMKAQKISDDGIRASLNVDNRPGVSFSNTSVRGETIPGMGVAISKEAPITFGNIAGPIDKNMSNSARTIAELTRAPGIDFHHVAGAPGIELTGRIASEQAGVSVLIGDHGNHHNSNHEEKQYHALGGLIYANNGAFIPKGKDTIPAMLTPGEFVVNSEATQKNLSLLQDINNGSIEYASNGALIGAKLKNIDTRPSENERSVLGAIGTGYYSRGGIVEYLNNGGRAKSQFIGEPPIASGNALYRPENERTQYQTMQYAAPAQDNIVNQSTNMATQSGVLNNNTNMQQSVGSGMGGMDITAIQRVFENFRQDLTILQESVTQFSTGAETMASSATQYKEVSTNIASSSDKLANLSLPDKLDVNVTSNLDKLGAGVTSEISGTIMRSNQGLVNNLQNYSDNGDKAMATRGFNDSEGALKLS